MIPKGNWKWVHAVLGVNWLANGVWMVFATAHWFEHMPQASQTGALNIHFTRDYGTVFMLIGFAQLYSLWRNVFTRAMHTWIFLFFLSHALTHVWDMYVGQLGHDHLTSGFPLVMIPVVLLAALYAPACWQKPA